MTKGSSKFQPKSQHKSQKINLQQSYPCPLCRGNLHSIALTDAVGCDRCHLILEVTADGYGMNQVGTDTRIWYWQGDRWKQFSKIFKENQMGTHVHERRDRNFALIGFILILSPAILLCLLARVPEFILGFAILTLLLLISWRFSPYNF